MPGPDRRLIQRAERLAWTSIGSFMVIYFVLDAWVIERSVAATWQPLARAGVLIVLSIATLMAGLHHFVGHILKMVGVRQSAAEAKAHVARLEGVLLAARTAEHELNNRLALTVGYAELLSSDASLSDAQRSYAEEAHRGAREAAELVQRLNTLQHVSERHWGANTTTTLHLEGDDPDPGAQPAV